MKKIKKLITVFIVCTLLVSCSKEYELVVLHTNDHHGHPLGFFDYPAGGQGGLPARATYVKSIREADENVLVVDAGDFNTGRPESNFFNGEPDILGYNYIGYDAVSMGNHEFDNSREIMMDQIKISDFPWLCANVKKDGKYLENVKPYIVKEYNGFKVAVLGLMTSETESTGNPETIGDLEFLDPVDVTIELLPLLKKKADIVIAVTHMGLYETNDTGSRRLAAAVPDLALIIDGHSHTKIDQPVVENGVYIVQARHWGLYVGNGKLRFKNGKVLSFDWKLDPVNVKYREKDENGNTTFHYVSDEVTEDKALLELLQPYADKVDIILGEIIGKATEPFLNDNTRNSESALGNIVADSQAWYIEKMGMEVDFAFQNGGGIRATLGSGDIQKQTIYEVLPFDNSITLVTLKGDDVIALFNKAAESVGSGAMPQVSKEIKLVISNGVVAELKIEGKRVYPEREYNIAVNSYLAHGGDGYDMFKENISFYDSSYMQRDAFIEYVTFLGGIISPETDGRITIE